MGSVFLQTGFGVRFPKTTIGKSRKTRKSLEIEEKIELMAESRKMMQTSFFPAVIRDILPDIRNNITDRPAGLNGPVRGKSGNRAKLEIFAQIFVINDRFNRCWWWRRCLVENLFPNQPVSDFPQSDY